jgi:ATP-dependent DNA helicase RecQ
MDPPVDPEARALWQALRDYRRGLAQAADVAAFHIFTDATLREILNSRPRDHEELSRIAGMGEVKRARFGDGILRVLAAHEAEHGRRVRVARPPARSGPSASERLAALSGTIRESLELFRSGLGPEQIARRRGLAAGTVYGHLARGIEEGLMAVDEVVSLDEESVRAIERVIDGLCEDDSLRLKTVYDAFDGRYDYGSLRCICAGMGVIVSD